MSDYTPTPEEARVTYAWADRGGGPEPEMEAEFDRMLAKVRADAWREGVNAGETQAARYYAGEHVPGHRNPYEETK